MTRAMAFGHAAIPIAGLTGSSGSPRSFSKSLGMAITESLKSGSLGVTVRSR